MYFLNQNNFRLFLRYFIGIGVIVVLIYHIQRQNNIMSIFWQFNFSSLFIICIVMILHLMILYYMWRSIILDIGRIRPRKYLIFHSFIGGRTLGFLTPGHMGELLKGLFFNTGLRMEVTSLSMLYAGYGLIINIVFGCVGCIYFIYKSPSAIHATFNYLYFFIIILIIVGTILLLVHRAQYRNYIRDFLPGNITELFLLVKNQIKTNSLHNSFKLFFLALVANILAAFGFMLLLEGFNLDAFTIDGLMAFEAAYLAMYLLPITPSGIGVREGSRVYFFSLIGYNQGAVLCASFIMFGINIIFPAIIGIWSLRYFWKKDSLST
ncbi:MAG: lysylphosphatidylglycerol synthase domain-containing protein [Candidatus Marinimicrobia bacterium]|nr:lysylphosphatidylglycerol synthase domain-containing protein [Candidatus Neomarinimicrobiota bacterium]MDP7127483.1 lysylphosphatidylglycerol synthase domain-containing protein [Candidatus Neomarinimicrobiota bacterium]MDP7608232.1 lysylphosphatidylglycerol synthase domain-containing protein [Candidatus Neomarinimicrobiota bacterium]